jgi:RHS repeat-associated protein
MAGISSKALKSAKYPENKSKFNGKELQSGEFSDGSGLEEYDFKYRFYDVQLGVFHNQDRLADKFAYMSPYQFCSNNPIWLREIDGLEGVKYTETDANGTKTVVEKNVVVLTQKTIVTPEGATQKQIDKVKRQNKRIEADNAKKIDAVKSELNDYYNGSDGGAKDSKGGRVEFKFNVTGVADFDKTGMSPLEIDERYNKIANDNKIAASKINDDGTMSDKKVQAGVITNEEPHSGNPGSTVGNIVRISRAGVKGTTAHEVSHTLKLNDNSYTSGGILNNPAEPILPSEVDQILKLSYDKK